MALRFFYNGIKGSDGALQKCHYSVNAHPTTLPPHIVIYGKGYKDFSKEVYDAFTVENSTDSRTDYFENDRIQVYPEHPLFKAVAKAVEAQARHFEARMKKQGYSTENADLANLRKMMGKG